MKKLLLDLNLGYCIETFQREKIDIQTFLTLNDEELKTELGVSALGDRKKLIGKINQMKIQNQNEKATKVYEEKQQKRYFKSSEKQEKYSTKKPKTKQ